jgi:hypothetical protein
VDGFPAAHGLFYVLEPSEQPSRGHEAPYSTDGIDEIGLFHQSDRCRAVEGGNLDQADPFCFGEEIDGHPALLQGAVLVGTNSDVGGYLPQRW